MADVLKFGTVMPGIIVNVPEAEREACADAALFVLMAIMQAIREEAHLAREADPARCILRITQRLIEMPSALREILG